MKSLFTTFLHFLQAALLLILISLRFITKRLHFAWVVLVRIGSGRIIRIRHMVCCWECFKRKFHIIDLRASQSLGKW